MCFPHIFVWGSCFWFCILSSAPAASSAQLCHTQFFTHDFVTHTQSFTHTHNLSHTHTALSHTIFQAHNFVTHTHAIFHTQLFVTHNLSHTQLCHTPNFVTHVTLPHTHTQLCRTHPHTIFPTHTHTTLSHTIFPKQNLSHTTLSHNLPRNSLSHTTLSHTHSLSRAIFQTQLCHTQSFTHNSLSHTIFVTHTQLCDIQSFTHNDAAALCVAGVALGDIHVPFVWQAWHLVTSTLVLRGRRGTYGTRLGLVAPLVGDAAALCVAGVALGDIHAPSAWQAWHWHVWHWPATHLFHTQLCLTQLCHTHLSHIQLCHTHTGLCHTQPFTHTHNSLTQNSFRHGSLTYDFFK